MVFEFLKFNSKYLKNSPSGPTTFFKGFEQVYHGVFSCEVNTGNGNRFGRHFGENPFFGIFWVFITGRAGIFGNFSGNQ